MIITRNLGKFKKFSTKFTKFMALKTNFSAEKQEENLTFENEDFDNTGLRIEKSSLTDFRRSRFFDERLRNEGEHFIPREFSDDMHLLMEGIILDHDPLSAYYSMEVNGRILHVFNAERYV